MKMNERARSVDPAPRLGPDVIKLFSCSTQLSMKLNSVEHEILNAHTHKNIKKFGLF